MHYVCSVTTVTNPSSILCQLLACIHTIGRGDNKPDSKRMLFVSGTGLLRAWKDEALGVRTASRAEDTMSTIGSEMWRPWPEVDVVVDTGLQVR